MNTKPLMTARDWVLAILASLCLVGGMLTYMVPYFIELDHRAKCEAQGLVAVDKKCVTVQEFDKKSTN